MKPQKSLLNHTKEDFDRINDCAPVYGTEYNCKCNKCGNIVSAEDTRCDRCGSYDIVDMEE